MKRVLIVVAALLVINVSLVIAHHPAADIVDPEIYAMIDEMVSDTPHATLVFDDDMGDGMNTTVIEIDSVSAADNLIDDGLLDGVSLLDGYDGEEVTITIEFPQEVESLLKSIDEVNQNNRNVKKWSEWGRPVTITINQPCEAVP